MRYRTTALDTKTCGAAMPLAAVSLSVSSMCITSSAISGAVGSSTASATLFNTSLPIRAIFNTAIGPTGYL